jgi:uncharacterized protein DUF6510
MTDHVDDRSLDGNAAAGPFEEIFGGDLTTVIVTCGGCSASAPFAEQRAYLHGPGTVLRCPGCDHLLARVVETRSELWLEMSGSSSWRFPIAD